MLFSSDRYGEIIFGESASYWSSSRKNENEEHLFCDDETCASFAELGFHGSKLIGFTDKNIGMTIRCIKD